VTILLCFYVPGIAFSPSKIGEHTDMQIQRTTYRRPVQGLPSQPQEQNTCDPEVQKQIDKLRGEAGAAADAAVMWFTVIPLMGGALAAGFANTMGAGTVGSWAAAGAVAAASVLGGVRTIRGGADAVKQATALYEKHNCTHLDERA
jgi:hypothetical protein